MTGNQSLGPMHKCQNKTPGWKKRSLSSKILQRAPGHKQPRQRPTPRTSLSSANAGCERHWAEICHPVWEHTNPGVSSSNCFVRATWGSGGAQAVRIELYQSHQQEKPLGWSKSKSTQVQALALYFFRPCSAELHTSSEGKVFALRHVWKKQGFTLWRETLQQDAKWQRAAPTSLGPHAKWD